MSVIINGCDVLRFLQSFLKLFALTVLLIFLIVFIRYTWFRTKFSNLLPGTKFRLLNPFGNLLDIPFKPSSRNGLSLTVYLMQFGGGFSTLFHKQKLFCVWFLYTPFVALITGESVEAILSGPKLMEKSWVYEKVHPFIGIGLLTSHGNKWKSRRKLLTPAFHFDILKDFIPVFNQQAQMLVKQLKKEIDKEFTDIILPITLCSLDIMCETILGAKIGAQENRESRYVTAVSRVTKTLLERFLKLWLWPDFIFDLTEVGRTFRRDIDVLHNFTRSIIQEKKRKLLNGDAKEVSKSRRKALMDLLLEHHVQTKDLTEEDIREEVDTFAFEGHDTTAMGMMWAMYMIGLYPDVQNKVHEELDAIFGDDTDRPVSTEDLGNMKYLECVLKESQRLYPSVPFYGRQVTEDMEVCGYRIPKGASIGVLTYALHRDEDVFPIPEKFDPDRFLPENSANRNPYAYVPFSAGPRNCIGQRFAMMEEKAVISTVMRNFTLHSLDPRDKMLAISELILRPSGPIRIRIRSRNSNTPDLDT